MLQQAIKEGNAQAFDVELRFIPVLPAVRLLHRGGFVQIGETFERLFSILGAHSLTRMCKVHSVATGMARTARRLKNCAPMPARSRTSR